MNYKAPPRHYGTGLEQIMSGRWGVSTQTAAGIAICALGFFFTRPTAYGEVYAEFGSTAILVGSIVVLASTNFRIYITKAVTLPVLLAIYAIYVFAADVLKDNYTVAAAPKAFLMSTAAAFGLFVISSRSRWARVFFDVLAFIIFLVCLSITITSLLLVSGASAESIKLFHFEYTYLPPSGDILFPFTLRNNATPTWFGYLPRLAGAFREVGILPAFASWAAFYLSARRFNLLFSAVCILASAVCLSSLGALIAAATVLFIAADRSKLPWYFFAIIAPLGAIILFTATYNLPYIGIGYKISHVNESFRDRSIAIQEIFETKDLLFGDGASSNRNRAINLPSIITQYGVVGLSLVILMYATALRKPKILVGGLSAMLFTVTVTQPIGADPLVLCLFMSWLALEDRSGAD